MFLYKFKKWPVSILSSLQTELLSQVSCSSFCVLNSQNRTVSNLLRGRPGRRYLPFERRGFDIYYCYWWLMPVCLSQVKYWLLLVLVYLITNKALKWVCNSRSPFKASWDSVVSPLTEDSALIESVLQVYFVVK